MKFDEIWNAVLGSIELSISKAQFGTWFKGTRILSLEKDSVYIRVPNGFAKEWLENKFNIIILRSLHDLGYPVKEIHCKVDDSFIPKEKVFSEKQSIPTKSIPTFSSEIKNFQPTSKNYQTNSSSNLNPRYTFENFIIGNHNELAYSACVAVYQDLGNAYNPLFIYGGVGLGKTHLLQSIGNAILKNTPEKKVLYITSEKFTQELINSIKNHTVDTFKSFYQNIDLLIIDDIQFLSGREKTQQEFFHIFNTLYQQNKQIVLSSDRPPKAIATLEDRLRSRFEGGMIADINRPDLETRIAILQEKAQQKNISLSDEIFSYIAENITNNVRELEGALTRITALQQFHHITHPTIKDVEDILKEIVSSGKKKAISQEDIIHSISSFYGISSEDLKQKGRKKEIAEARQMAMYLMRKELHLPYTGIGRCFGGRDHTTALHAFEKIEKLLDTDEKTRKDVSFLKEKIYCIE
ncbi:MAG: chromosomal replication initiator protein DnaA [Candidatus Moraniibacteriota bacterium]|nr:MAG: chromosomal replication initiator protein DnaA [Candidatus Moranbacteria bacterium]